MSSSLRSKGQLAKHAHVLTLALEGGTVMPAGGVGDHPLTDIIFHKVEVYGPACDELIRKIADLCSRRELEEWWDREIAWSKDSDMVRRKATIRFDQLVQRAKEGGWELR